VPRKTASIGLSLSSPSMLFCQCGDGLLCPNFHGLPLSRRPAAQGIPDDFRKGRSAVEGEGNPGIEGFLRLDKNYFFTMGTYVE